jgi:oligopeptide transport system substrate-binding protein
VYRTLCGILLALGLLLALAGLSFSASTGRPADFRFVNGTEPETLDPHRMTGNIEGRIGNAVFEGLTRRDAKTMEAAPGVAERWDVSEDQLRYTFHLRRDAHWSDGTKITAHDFVYSWKRLLNPDFGADYAYLLYPVRHAEAFNAYGRRIAALRDGLLPKLSSWLSEPAERVPARAFQALLSAEDAFENLKGAQSQKLAQLLAQREGDVDKSVLGDLPSLIRQHVEALEKSLAQARAHLGKDAGVFATDDHTLIVELRAPTAYFLHITSFYPSFPVPQHVVEAHPRDWFLPPHLVGNGPFDIESWRVNDRIRLIKSERYWGKSEVGFDIVEALSMDNPSTVLNLYLSGDIDWVPDALYPTELVDDLRKRSDFYSNAGLVVYFYRFNTTRPPFDDARVRKAVCLAIDRQVIVDELLRLGQLPAYTFVPPGMPGYDPPETALRYDARGAQKLLADAGHPGGRGLSKIGILYNTNERHKQIADLVTDQLRRNLGIEIAPYNQEWQSFLETVRTIDYDMARAGWIGDYPDPNTFLDMWVTNGGNNQTGFSSPIYDALLASAANIEAFVAEPARVLEKLDDAAPLSDALRSIEESQEPAKKVALKAKLRLELLRRAESILVIEEFPICPIYFYVVSGLVSPRLRGFYSTLELEDGSKAANLQDVHPLRNMTLVPAEEP